MARRRAVLWATGLSLALVLGSGTIALGAGAFAEPPVDRAGSFAAINAEFTPTSTSTRANTAPAPTARPGRSAGARPLYIIARPPSTPSTWPVM